MKGSYRFDRATLNSGHTGAWSDGAGNYHCGQCGRAYGGSACATWAGVQRELDALVALRSGAADTERPAEALPQHDHEMSDPMNDPEEG